MLLDLSPRRHVWLPSNEPLRAGVSALDDHDIPHWVGWGNSTHSTAVIGPAPVVRPQRRYRRRQQRVAELSPCPSQPAEPNIDLIGNQREYDRRRRLDATAAA